VPEAGFHFEQPLWFLALLGLVPVAIWLWRSAARAARGPVHRYADPHLLPHLTGTRELKTQERWGRFLKWSLLWALLVLAMAGPRWDYTDMRLFHPGNNLMILLDISRSMQVADVAPSRIGRARQEIQDLIMQDRDVRLGLIAFASVPHVVAPVTEDTFTVLNALPALSTDLTELQGSRVGAALERAEGLLKGLPAESSRAILLISDGDFDEPDLNDRVAKLAEEGIRLHVLGIGTEQGARVPAPPPAQAGSWITDRSGKPVVSALNTKLLEGLAATGQGIYRLADYRDGDTQDILKAAAVSKLPPQAGDERTRVWHERFYLPLLVIVALMLPGFRGQERGAKRDLPHHPAGQPNPGGVKP
jgi:Ca-activated chloride channel family protein